VAKKKGTKTKEGKKENVSKSFERKKNSIKNEKNYFSLIK